MNIDKVVSHSISLPKEPKTKETIENNTQSVALQTKNGEETLLHNGKATSIGAEEMETIADQLNGFLDPVRTNVKFVFHEKLNEYYVTLVDPITKETVKEIPPKKMLDMYASMAELMGILIDRKI